MSIRKALPGDAHWLAGLAKFQRQRHLLSLTSGGWKPEIKVSLWWLSPKSIFGHLCPLMVLPLYMRRCPHLTGLPV
jgi:hypothetical protein